MLENEPIQIPPGEHVSYAADGFRPYYLLEIYNNSDRTHTAALVTWLLIDTYLPAKLRWRKRRNFIATRGASAMEHAVRTRFPTARYIANDDGALVEFAVSLEPGDEPIPAQLEKRLIAETPAISFYEQLHRPDSPLTGEVQQRLQLASQGTEWQKYFTGPPVYNDPSM